MMNRTRSQKAVAVARAAVETERNKLESWKADQAGALAELASLQERAGLEVLDDPGAAVRLPKAMQELRDRAEIAARAVTAQGPRVEAAERAYLALEADLLEPLLVVAQTNLQRHNMRTAGLLKALEGHEGPYVPAELLEEARVRYIAAMGGDVGPGEQVITTSEKLQRAVWMAEKPILILREMAAGRDPQQLPDIAGLTPATVYPACVWGPDAVVKAPAYLRTVRNRESALGSLQDQSLPTARGQVRELEEELAAVTAQYDAAGVPQHQRVELQKSAGFRPRGTLADRLHGARAHVTRIEDQINAERGVVEALTRSADDGATLTSS